MIDMIEITNIQHKRVDEQNVALTFCINGFSYSLSIEKDEEGFFVPWALFHDSNEACPLCPNKGTIMNCRFGDIKKLFHYLIEQPSIRLEWVFLKHKEGSGR